MSFRFAFGSYAHSQLLYFSYETGSPPPPPPPPQTKSPPRPLLPLFFIHLCFNRAAAVRRKALEKLLVQLFTTLNLLFPSFSFVHIWCN
jgi:hypothetical protein